LAGAVYGGDKFETGLSSEVDDYHLKTPKWGQDKLNLEKNMDKNRNNNLYWCRDLEIFCTYFL
jgi:hypothetical protein